MLPFTTNLTCDNHISGASIGVFCGSSGKTRRSWARNTTDEDGEFLIDLPSHLHAIPNLEKTCCVKVLHLPRDTICRHAFRGQHKGLELASIGEGIRTYTTQTIHLTPKAATRPCGKKVVVMWSGGQKFSTSNDSNMMALSVTNIEWLSSASFHNEFMCVCVRQNERCKYKFLYMNDENRLYFHWDIWVAFHIVIPDAQKFNEIYESDSIHCFRCRINSKHSHESTRTKKTS